MNKAPTPKSFVSAAIFGIAFVTYNVLLFAIAGFSDHGGAFWCSYVFMLLAFATAIGGNLMLKTRATQPKDWFLGYPIMKHCFTYLIAELVLSALFMILDANDCSWVISFALQFLLFAVFATLILSGFLVKDMIQEVSQNAKKKTSQLKLLQVDVEMIATASNDQQIKFAYTKLAETIRFSDPMSSDALADLENQIAYLVQQAKTYAAMNDVPNALMLSEKINLLLVERNKKCKILK